MAVEAKDPSDKAVETASMPNTAYAPAVNGRPATASRGSRLKAAERLTSKFTKQSQNRMLQPTFLAPSE